MKIIKLKEHDLKKIVDRIVNEQMNPTGQIETNRPIERMEQSPEQLNGIGPYPEKKPIPGNNSPEAKERIRIKYATNESLATAKHAVRKNLNEALASMNQLLDMSGINRNHNNIIKDIEKVIERFEALYGDPEEKEVPKKE